MKVLDPGHTYLLDCFDAPEPVKQHLVFFKREGADYLGNDSSYPGTNCQEALRALIDRVKYMHQQQPCNENYIILNALRSALLAFELRAARRHNRVLLLVDRCVENEQPNCTDGHLA